MQLRRQISSAGLLGAILVAGTLAASASTPQAASWQAVEEDATPQITQVTPRAVEMRVSPLVQPANRLRPAQVQTARWKPSNAGLSGDVSPVDASALLLSAPASNPVKVTLVPVAIAVESAEPAAPSPDVAVEAAKPRIEVAQAVTPEAATPTDPPTTTPETTTPETATTPETTTSAAGVTIPETTGATVGATVQTTPAVSPAARPYRIGPAISLYNPSGWGLSRRRAAVWGLYQNRTRLGDGSDGSIGLVVGLGNPRRLGFDVGVNLLSLSSSRGGDEGFGERGSFNFKLHHTFPGNDLAVAVGVRNTLIWGGSDAATEVYGVVSKMIRLKDSPRQSFSRLYLSAGVEYLSTSGTRRRFRPVVNDLIREVGRTNVFGSAAIRVTEPISVFTEWTGEDLNVGASYVPFRRVPLVITAAFVDLTHNVSDRTRFNLAAAYVFSF